MKANTKSLQEAFSIVNRVESHAGLLSSQFLKLIFESNRIRMLLSGLVFSEVKVPAEQMPNKTFFVDRRVFEAFLNASKAESLDIVMEKEQLLLKCGRSKVHLSTMDEIGGYSTWKPNGSQSLSVKDAVRNDIAMLARYAPITAAADHLSAVYMVKGFGIIATDSFVMAARIDPLIKTTIPIPVVLSKLLQETKSDEVMVESTGAGIKFPPGYLYQTLSDRLTKDYPLNQVKGLLNQGIKAPVNLTFKAGDLKHGIDHIRMFIFGSDVDVMLECSVKQADSFSDLNLSLSQGKAHKRIPVKSKVDQGYKWPIAHLEPWVTHIAGIDSGASIECFSLQYIHGFRASIGKVKYLLLITENQC